MPCIERNPWTHTHTLLQHNFQRFKNEFQCWLGEANCWSWGSYIEYRIPSYQHMEKRENSSLKHLILVHYLQAHLASLRAQLQSSGWTSTCYFVTCLKTQQSQQMPNVPFAGATAASSAGPKRELEVCIHYLRASKHFSSTYRHNTFQRATAGTKHSLDSVGKIGGTKSFSSSSIPFFSCLFVNVSSVNLLVICLSPALNCT